MSSVRCLPMVAALVVACGAEVKLEDGGEASSGGALVSGSGVGGGTAAGGGASSGGDGGGAAYDPVEGCGAMCERDCTGNPALCEKKCLEVVYADWVQCAEQVVALHACRGEACGFDDPDCAAEERALDACHDVHSCGASVYGATCETSTMAQCDCTSGCLDGHVARIVCVEVEPGATYTRDCDCYFDEQLVGQCRLENSSGGCTTDLHNCCEDFFVR